ncbi:MAG: PhnD/SsuA/transferrin family substrate-binding protein [Polyangiaceae bacterium]|nr:PhnD/SsuA/transferrin family substrate-binding protein [Polyangiaceae bacterium]
MNTLLLGAVAYDPKVVTIWDGFRSYFAKHGLDLDYVLFSNYERQVLAHLAGHVHVAWSSPLAWLQVERAAAVRGRTARAIAMRDTDRDLTSVIVAQRSVATLGELKGKRVAVGAADSPQATMIPLEHLAANGLVAGRDFEVVYHDVLVGKHGDHIGGERDAAKALASGAVDAACLLDGNHLAFSRDGTLAAGKTHVVAQTARYDHCNFTVLDDAPPQLVARFESLLSAMRYDDAEVRPLMDLEGLKAWAPGRTSGYATLAASCERFGSLKPLLDQAARELPVRA